FLLIFLLNVLAAKQFSTQRKIYPYHIWLIVLLFWTLITTFYSEMPFRSTKYLLAKIWYLVAFVYTTEHILQKREDFRLIFWCFGLPMTFFSLYTTYKHSLEGFSFESCNLVPSPYFINHVIYGAMLSLFFPWIWFYRQWYANDNLKKMLIYGCAAILLIGWFFTYGRLAWGSALLLPFIYFFIKYKWFDKLLYIGLVIAFFAVTYLVSNNNFYKFAPDFANTIYHDDVSDHLSATVEGKDISSMERFYRWVAAKNMVEARPLLGFGPSTFNQTYQKYADAAFRTYVSQNEEQSTTHNYFLMTCSEQGFIGMFIFLGLCVYMLLKGYHLYHLYQDPLNKQLVMMLTLSLSVIIMHLVLNELIEVDKVGGMFWFCMTSLHLFEKWKAEGRYV
ncbi:MAG: O-antigen ligase family protein, partial [Bacteroidia bacterium]